MSFRGSISIVDGEVTDVRVYDAWLEEACYVVVIEAHGWRDGRRVDAWASAAVRGHTAQARREAIRQAEQVARDRLAEELGSARQVIEDPSEDLEREGWQITPWYPQECWPQRMMIGRHEQRFLLEIGARRWRIRLFSTSCCRANDALDIALKSQIRPSPDRSITPAIEVWLDLARRTMDEDPVPWSDHTLWWEGATLEELLALLDEIEHARQRCMEAPGGLGLEVVW